MTLPIILLGGEVLPSCLRCTEWLQGSDTDYEVSGYFGEHKYSLFGKDRKRLLIEADSDVRGALVAYPLRASGRPAPRQLAAVEPATSALRNRRMGRF